MIEKKYDLLTKKWVPLERKTKGRDSCSCSSANITCPEIQYIALAVPYTCGNSFLDAFVVG